MSNLETLSKQLDPLTDTTHPPVHLWTPEHIGDIDIVIRHDGQWLHEGELIQREALVKLFAGILWFEQGQYYLKTPAEQLKISVETTAFLITSMEVLDAGTDTQQIVFYTHYGDRITLSEKHSLFLDTQLIPNQEVPLLNVRYHMNARLSRSVFNELIEYGEHLSDSHGESLRFLSQQHYSTLAFN